MDALGHCGHLPVGISRSAPDPQAAEHAVHVHRERCDCPSHCCVHLAPRRPAARGGDNRSAAATKKAKWKAQSDQLRNAMRANRLMKEATDRGEDIRHMALHQDDPEDDDRWGGPGWCIHSDSMHTAAAAIACIATQPFGLGCGNGWKREADCLPTSLT